MFKRTPNVIYINISLQYVKYTMIQFVFFLSFHLLNIGRKVIGNFNMKKLLPLLLLFGFGTAVNAGGMSTRHQTSLQLTVDAARTTSTRVGNSYSIAGNNVTTTHSVSDGSGGTTTVTGGLGVHTYSNGVAVPGTITAGQGTTNGTGSFSFSQNFTQGDALTAATDQTVYTAGAAGSGAPGTITNAHAVVISGGSAGAGSGSTVTGQFVSEITVFD